METATLAGGCFWCTEAIFKRLKGVTSVVPGYAGGQMENPSYEEVCSGTTGHAEAIQIEFDQSIISYDKILGVFWHLHDPTTPNQQGNDIGTQYRSAIFYHDEKQKQIAEESKEELEKSGMYKNIVTEIVPFTNFYKAENYHQNYYDQNKSARYCQVVIDPKIQKLMSNYKEEAAKKRASLSAVIREKISLKKSQQKSPEEIIRKIRKHASDNAKYLKGVDIVKTLREMRYEGKW